jgi:hypothetical protein
MLEPSDRAVGALVQEHRAAHIRRFFSEIIRIDRDDAVVPIPRPGAARIAFDKANLLAGDLHGEGLEFTKEKGAVGGGDHLFFGNCERRFV